jgi:hypothetical protein
MGTPNLTRAQGGATPSLPALRLIIKKMFRICEAKLA